MKRVAPTTYQFSETNFLSYTQTAIVKPFLIGGHAFLLSQSQSHLKSIVIQNKRDHGE